MFVLFSLALAVVPTDDARHANHFHEPTHQTVDGVTLEIHNPWARAQQSKVSLVIRNLSADLVGYRYLESTLGDGLAPQTLAPHEATSQVLAEPGKAIEGQLIFRGEGLHQEQSKVAIAGVVRFPRDQAEVVALPNVQLPLTTRRITEGAVTCAPTGKLKKSTDETRLKLDCTYTGENVLYVDAATIQVQLEDGKRFATDEKSSALVVEPGGSFDLTASFHVSAKITDMQFATMQVVFNDAVREARAVPVAFEASVLTLDAGLTATKND